MWSFERWLIAAFALAAGVDANITVEHRWSTVWPYFSTETAFRSVDVNGDGILDVLVGFATGVTRPNVAACWELFRLPTAFCGGGIAALEGRTGNLLWRTFSRNEVYALTCRSDIDQDGTIDCVGCGRLSTMLAVSGKSGRIIWTLDTSPPAIVRISNFYTAQLIEDVDADGVQDFLNINGGDPFKKKGEVTRVVARLVVVSGLTGRIIRWIKVPDGVESYNSPQVLRYANGSSFVLFGTGGETTPGSLWLVDLVDLIMTASMRTARRLMQDSEKGFMVPPILVDVDSDGVRDIVMAPFGTRVVAISGKHLNVLWQYEEVPNAETYSTPAVGHFDDDGIPDLMLQFNHGPGFPIYSDAVVRVLSGRTGRPFRGSMNSLLAVQSSPLTIARPGIGNDFFVYAVSDCEGRAEGVASLDVATSGVSTSTYKLSRTNLCRMRFGKTPRMITRIFAMSRQTGFPGIELYSSKAMRSTEYSQAAMLYTARRVTDLLRAKRHVGAHDGEGLLRTISTGMILLSESGSRSGVFFTFAAFWSFNPIPPCVEKKMQLEVFRFNTTSGSQQDHDAFKEAAEEECGGGEPLIEGDLMSQMSVHRLWLNVPGGVAEYQPWPQYMGADGDCYV